MRNICIFTGTRAEYGLLSPLLSAIKLDSEVNLQLLVSGMHLAPEFGLTYREIENDGFSINEKVEILTSSDSDIGLCKSIGLGLIGFSEALARLSPDILIILGDRFEAFAAASAAMVCRIPIAHIHGGEATYGLIDEPIRHSITKMSHLHFTSTEKYRQRVIQLGEHPSRVYNVGALGIENIKNIALLSRKQLEKKINFALGKKCILVTFHPVTLENKTAKNQFKNLLDALKKFRKFRIIFTKTNADTDGRIINQMIDDFVENNKDRCIAFTSMGQVNYLSTLKHVDAVIGNSSSGIIEAPSLQTPTINIGERQKGRVKADSIIDCEPSDHEITAAMNLALSEEFKARFVNIQNPYEGHDTTYSILYVLKKADLANILKKQFYKIPFTDKFLQKESMPQDNY
jgi:GDP/UDP-N,N'-diacetylbacillosamine 2-epimerase (hydrolysing)